MVKVKGYFGNIHWGCYKRVDTFVQRRESRRYSGAEIAQYLEVTTSCVTRAISSEKGLQAEVIFKNLCNFSENVLYTS